MITGWCKISGYVAFLREKWCFDNLFDFGSFLIGAGQSFLRSLYKLDLLKVNDFGSFLLVALHNLFVSCQYNLLSPISSFHLLQTLSAASNERKSKCENIASRASSFNLSIIFSKLSQILILQLWLSSRYRKLITFFNDYLQIASDIIILK